MQPDVETLTWFSMFNLTLIMKSQSPLEERAVLLPYITEMIFYYLKTKLGIILASYSAILEPLNCTLL